MKQTAEVLLNRLHARPLSDRTGRLRILRAALKAAGEQRRGRITSMVALNAERNRYRTALEDIARYVLPVYATLVEPCVKLEHAKQLREFANDALQARP